MKSLHELCRSGDLEALKAIVESGNGLDMMVEDAEGKYPYDYACENGHTDVLRYLYEEGPKLGLDLGAVKEESVYTARERGHLETVEFLISEAHLMDKKFAIEKIDVSKILGFSEPDWQINLLRNLIQHPENPYINQIPEIISAVYLGEDPDPFFDVIFLEGPRQGYFMDFRPIRKRFYDTDEFYDPYSNLSVENSTRVLANERFYEMMDIGKLTIEDTDIFLLNIDIQLDIIELINAGFFTCREAKNVLTEVQNSLPRIEDKMNRCFRFFSILHSILILSKYNKIKAIRYVMENAEKLKIEDYDGREISPSDTTIQKDLFYVFQIAVRHGRLDFLKFLLEEAPKMGFTAGNKDGSFFLSYAVEEGHLPVVRYLMEEAKDSRFVSINFSGMKLQGVAVAVDRGHIEVLHYLFDKAPAMIETPITVGENYVNDFSGKNFTSTLPYLFEKCTLKGLLLDCRGMGGSNLNFLQNKDKILHQKIMSNRKICTLLEQGTISRPEADLLYTSGATDQKGIEKMLEAVEAKLMSVEEAVQALTEEGQGGNKRRRI